MSFVGVIYKITNLINGKVYIGQTTKSINRRFSQHCNNPKGLIGKAIKKYGKNNFKINILLFCSTLDELETREKYCIKLYKSISPNGYNLTSGGEIKKEYTKITLKKLSKAKKGKSCPAQSVAMKGRKLAVEHKTKIAISLNSKPFKVYDKDTKKLVGTYISKGECARILNLDRRHLNSCLNKKRKSHKNYIFCYEVNHG